MKKNISEGFEYPAECPLSKKEKVALLTKFRRHGRTRSFFSLCERSKWIDCPGRIHLECFVLAGGQQKKMIQESSQN